MKNIQNPHLNTLAASALQSYTKIVGPNQYIQTCNGGLVNRTFAVGNPPNFTLQLVNNPIKDTQHVLMEKIAARLTKEGIRIPQILRDDQGRLTQPGPHGSLWRLFRWIPGDTHLTPPSIKHLYSAAKLFARFHVALSKLSKQNFAYTGFHDTPRYISQLDQLGPTPGKEVEIIRTKIQKLWPLLKNSYSPKKNLRPGHGDPKLANFIFAKGSPSAIALIDLDTLGLYQIGDEIGDAIRAWCNLASENQTAAQFDVDRFRALINGYFSTPNDISLQERRLLIPGGARIALELSARFLIDAVEETYFAWDPSIAKNAREHNLIRANNQYDLAQKIISKKDVLQQIVDNAG